MKFISVTFPDVNNGPGFRTTYGLQDVHISARAVIIQKRGDMISDISSVILKKSFILI